MKKFSLYKTNFSNLSISLILKGFNKLEKLNDSWGKNQFPLLLFTVVFLVIYWANGSSASAGDSITWSAKLKLFQGGKLWVAGDLQLGGNDIIDSGGTTRLTIGGVNKFYGNLTVYKEGTNLGNIWADGKGTIGYQYDASEDVLDLYRATNTAGDKCVIKFNMKDSDNVYVPYARIKTEILSNVAGSHEGQLFINVARSGTTYKAIIIYPRNSDQTSNIDGSTSVSIYNLYSVNPSLSSARRFKENIRDIDDLTNLAKVFDVIKLKKFRFKGTSFDKIGIIVDDIVEALPELDFLVVKDEEGKPMAYRLDELIMILIAKIKILENEINKLKKRGFAK